MKNDKIKIKFCKEFLEERFGFKKSKINIVCCDISWKIGCEQPTPKSPRWINFTVNDIEYSFDSEGSESKANKGLYITWC